ncbi:MAG: peptidase inhibitor family I36 protein [Betaproteobacteria bacterium]
MSLFTCRAPDESRVASLSLSIVVSAMLAACGGGNGQTATDSQAEATTAAATAAAAASVPASSPVCFFESVDYQGAHFCASANSTWLGAAWNDRISSIKVSAGYKVTLFQDINYGGQSLVLTGNHASLVTYKFNDAASSFKVTAPPVATAKVGGIQIAQSLLFNSNDGALVLVANKAALLKVNAVATVAGAAKPTGHLHVDNVNGGASLDLLLATPTAALPTSVPQVPSFADSYTATIPADYVKSGLRLAVSLGSAAATTLTPRVGGGVPMKFVPIAVNIAGTAGTRPADQGAHLQALFPVSSVTVQQHVTYTSTRVTALPTTDDAWSDAFGKILGELADLHAIEGAAGQDHYFGFLPKRTWGLAGLAYIGGSAGVAFDMPSAPTSVRDVVAHELGHNFSLLHAACGGAGDPDPNYPYPDANLGKAGRAVWPYLADDKTFYDPRPTDRHDIMSYCGGQVFSDYNYGVMQAWLNPADKAKASALSVATTASTSTAATEPREVLLVSGEVSASGVQFNPVKAFVGKAGAAASGTHVLRVVTVAGAMDYPFTPLRLDHDAKVQHFVLTIPNTGVVQSITVLRQGLALGQAHAAGASAGDRTSQSAPREPAPLQLREAGSQLSVTWDARKTPFATVTWVGPTGQRVTLAQDLRSGSAVLATQELPAGGSFEVILSDGLNATRQAVPR